MEINQHLFLWKTDMIFGCSADYHITAKTPETRIDDYTEAILEKFQIANDLFENEGCTYVLNAGDFWDSEKEPYWLVNWMIDYFRNKMWARNNWFLTVAGQHDQVNHTKNLENTPYQTLVASGCITHLTGTPLQPEPGTHIYGMSWGEKTPKIINPDGVNILVCHDLLVKEKIWEGQENVKYGVDFLKKNKFDFIICGDNHRPFQEIYRGRVLIMCGSLGRLKSDQKDYQPHVYTIDTGKLGDFNSIKIPIKNKKVFDVSKKIKVKANKKELLKFIRTLDKRSKKISFQEKVLDKKTRIKNPYILKEIEDILGGSHEL